MTCRHCSVHKARMESPSQMCMFDKRHFDYNFLLFTPFLTVYIFKFREKTLIANGSRQWSAEWGDKKQRDVGRLDEVIDGNPKWFKRAWLLKINNNNTKRSLFTINLVNYTIDLPELKKPENIITLRWKVKYVSIICSINIYIYEPVSGI